MKLITLILLVSVASVTANSYSQTTRFTMKLEKKTVREVIAEIEENSEFVFLYSEKMVDVDRKVSVVVEDENVESILDQVFNDTENYYEIHNRQITIMSKDKTAVTAINGSQETPQTKTINGKVSDDTGQPLPGVAVIVKGTTIGTVTDFDGNYTLTKVSADATLVFSFVGMLSQEIQVGNQNTINVELKTDAIGLEEVVAIGYGTQKKKDLTGATAEVKGESLMKAPTPNLAANLSGKLTGVMVNTATGQPGAEDITFKIRGVNTTGDSSPLVIVDGVERSFSRIDPNEIESITVLKDAASTAVYGARAANGVLLVTTKRGKSGKASFNYSYSYGSQAQTKRVEMMNAGEYATYINEAKRNFGQQPIFTDEEVAKYVSGELPSYNWFNSVLKNSAPIQKHNLSASGGTEKAKYFVSYGFLDQDGFYSTAKYKQNNVRSNIDVALSDRLQLSVDLSGRIEDRTDSPADKQTIYSHSSIARPWLKPRLDAEVGPGAIGLNGQGQSPIGAAERSGFANRLAYVLQSNFNLKYQIPGIDGLSAKAFYSYDLTTSKNKTFVTPYTAYDYNGATGGYDEVQSGGSSISLNERRDLYTQNTLQLGFNYENTFGRHKVGAVALFEQIEEKGNFISAFRDNFISPSLPELFAGGTDLWSNNGSSSETARRRFIGRVDYSYKDKYLFQGNIGIDKSFNFHKDKRTGVFPAFSAGWRVSEEDFLQPVEWISNLKLRTSWGITGNDRVPAYQYMSLFGFGGGMVANQSFIKGIDSSGIPNPNITWETAKTFDIGLNFGVLDEKLSFEFDYFKKRTEDILRPNAGIVPATFGASLPDINNGIVDSWGWESLLRYQNTFGEFRLVADVNASWYENKAVYLAEAEGVLPAIAQTGKSLNQRVGYLSDGLFQTQEEIDAAPIQISQSIHNGLRPGDVRYKDINGRDSEGNLTGKPDGKVNADDRAIIGSSGDPHLSFGLNVLLEYKGFDVSANFQGASQFSRQLNVESFGFDGNSIKELIDSWRPGNEDAKYPRLVSAGGATSNNYQTSDFWVTEVRYIKLRNLELGYNFEAINETLKRIGVDRLRLFVSGTNLLTISNLGWRDPEGPSGNQTNALYYPQIKTMSVGINVGF